MPKIKRSPHASVAQTQSLMASLQICDHTFTNADALLDMVQQAVSQNQLAPERIPTPPPPVTPVRGARPLQGPGSAGFRPIYAMAHTAATPLKLPDYAKNATGLSPSAQALMFLVERQCTPESIDEAIERFGRSELKATTTHIYRQIMALRAAVPVAERAGPFYNHLFVIMSRILPYTSATAITRTIEQKYPMTLAADAGRLLDHEALKQLLDARGLRQAPQKGEREALRMLTINLLAQEVCASEAWGTRANDGVICFELLTAAMRAQFSATDWHTMCDSVDAAYMLAIKHRRESLLPAMADHIHATRAQVALPESKLLLCMVDSAWELGIETLLRSGVSPMNRDPGFFSYHATFSSGILPLTLAAKSKNITDEALRLRIIEKLLDAGACPHASYTRNTDGTGEIRPQTAFEAAAGSGHTGALQRLLKAEQQASVGDDWLNSAKGLIERAQTLAQSVLRGDLANPQQNAESAVGIAREAHALTFDAGRLSHPLYVFSTATGEMFDDISITPRPCFTPKDSLPATLGGEDRLSTEKRLELWARNTLNILTESEGSSSAQAPTPPPKNALAMLDVLQSGYRAFASPLEHGGKLSWMVLPHSMSNAKALFHGEYALVEQTVLHKGISTQADRATTFFLAMHAMRHERSHATAAARIVATILCCTTEAEDVGLLAQMAMILEDRAVLDLVLQRSLKLCCDLTGCSFLFHQAAVSPAPIARQLLSHVPTSMVAGWATSTLEDGQTPLHTAARRGLAPLQLLLDHLPSSQLEALYEIPNASGKTPALEALSAGQVATFLALSKRGPGSSVGELLIEALCARSGQVDSKLMLEIAATQRGEKLLRDNAGKLARRLARLNDAKGLRTVAAQYKNEVFALRPRQQNLLHVVALAESEPLLDAVVSLASPGQLRTLAEQADGDGNLPEQCPADPALAQRFGKLRGIKATARALSASEQSYLRLRQLTNKIARPSSSANLEASTQALLNACGARDAAFHDDAPMRARRDELLWEAVEHIARAQYGQRMGAHFELHRPDVAREALHQRALSTNTGASKFGAQGAYALLQGRAQALAEVTKLCASVPMLPGARHVVNVPCEGLDGEGYRRDRRGEMSYFTKAQTLRAVFAQEGNKPVLITLYPVVS